MFTAENARAMGAKGLVARLENKVKRQAMLIEAEKQIDKALELGVFTQDRLLRVRKQLSMLDERIQAEIDKARPDGQLLDRMVSAQSRLAEQERQLAGRPLPGSLKPSSRPPKPVKQAPTILPDPATVSPTVAPPTQAPDSQAQD